MADLPPGMRVDVLGRLDPRYDGRYVLLDVEGTTFEFHPGDARRVGEALIEASHKAEDEIGRIDSASEVRGR